MIDSFNGEYKFLSNFYMAEVKFEQILYPSSEHAYQAAKFIPRCTKLAIAELKTPGQAKRMGRKPGMREDWDTVRDSIMEEIVRIKFHTHKDLTKKLVETGDEELVEGNTWGDIYWGVCGGVGQNKLGKILMQIRLECKLFGYE